MLRLKILPVGYIYPRSERPVRDLLRKRGHLVRLRTSLIINLQHIVTRNCGIRVDVNQVKMLKEDRVTGFLEEYKDLELAGAVSKESIDFLTRKIREIERVVEVKAKLKDTYRSLLTLPGVGKILALTIMMETSPIERFPAAGHYASYCRKVSGKWLSNGKQKGKGNSKNGNKFWPGPFLRQPSWPDDMILTAAGIFNGRCKRQTGWSLIMP